ncbi:hypothetical protein ACQ7HM_10580 [Williamsia sp. MIQD14]|uniref:hypothetical protein n=1 Tax=Williamsia sp. MIQD14 TaxID=3425703 RepID=UPI003DA16F93
MTRSGIARLVVVAIAGLVVALSLATVRSTGALWSDRANAASATATTGTLTLVAGSGSGSSYQFPALNGSNILTGDQTQAPLVISNGGSTPLRYRLTTAGPVLTSGPAATVALSGAVGGSCGAGALTGATAFTPVTTSTPVATTSSWRSLARGASETWCVRSVLQSVAAGTGSSTYTIAFTFGTEQTRP